MPTFDIVSRLDMQEVRNAVDQAAREVNTRYDFRNTGTSIVLGDDTITLNSSTEDRLAAARQVLEEKLVRRKVSLKALDYGKVQEAARATVRQVAGTAGRHLFGPVPRTQQVHQGPRPQGRAVVHPRRPAAGAVQEARRPPSRDLGPQRRRLRPAPAVTSTSGTRDYCQSRDSRRRIRSAVGGWVENILPKPPLPPPPRAWAFSGSMM